MIYFDGITQADNAEDVTPDAALDALCDILNALTTPGTSNRERLQAVAAALLDCGYAVPQEDEE